MQNTNLDNWKLIMIVAAITLVVFLVLPIGSINYNGTEVASLNGLNYITGSVEASFMGVTQTIPVKLEIDVILIILGAVAAFFGALKKIKKISLIGAAVGAVVVLLNVVNIFGGSSELMQGMEVSVGIGYWLSLVGFAACGFLAFKAE